MANQRTGRNDFSCRQEDAAPCRQEHKSGVGEPQMRRWPHPVEVRGNNEAGTCPQMQYVHCALAYQNQLLADIKALMEKLIQNERQEE